jgi:hypothetical protein
LPIVIRSNRKKDTALARERRGEARATVGQWNVVRWSSIGHARFLDDDSDSRADDDRATGRGCRNRMGCAAASLDRLPADDRRRGRRLAVGKPL